MRILSRAEQQRLSDYLRENLTPSNMGILLCLYSGLRIGEICALTWADILFEEQCLYIHQTMQRVQVKGDVEKRQRLLFCRQRAIVPSVGYLFPMKSINCCCQTESRTRRTCLREWYTVMWNPAIWEIASKQ